MRSLLVLLAALPLYAQDPVVLPKAPPGFKVELVLAAPDIEAPTALCVAPNGDVYFAEDPMDMAGSPVVPTDKIWMLKGGDPKKKILVADKMWAVMGLELVGQRLFVVHAPWVSVFDLDADGKPTGRTDLFDDLGPKVAGLPGFNDHIPSGIRYGMDGWLYVSIGDKGIPKMSKIPIPKRKQKVELPEGYAGSTHVAEGVWRQSKEGHHVSLQGGGVIRFRPDGSGLEVFASGTRNHLDVPMDELDRIFVRDNTDDGDGWNTRLMYLPRGGFAGYPWAFKKQPREIVPAIHDFGGGSPCGGWVYTDDGLPEEWRGRIFHCEWGKGKVFAVKVKPKGAGFEYVDEMTLLDPAGSNGTVKDFRPFSIRPTHDGRGFYVTDWGHSGWLAKVKAGRIWKVTYAGDNVKPMPRTMGKTIEELIDQLGHPSHTFRMQVQHKLQTMPEFYAGLAKKGTTSAVAKLIANPKVNPALRRHLLHAAARPLVEGASPAFPELSEDEADETVRREFVRVCTDPTRLPHFLADFKPLPPVVAHQILATLPGQNQTAGYATERGTKALSQLGYAEGSKDDPWLRQAAVRATQAILQVIRATHPSFFMVYSQSGDEIKEVIQTAMVQSDVETVAEKLKTWYPLDSASRPELLKVVARSVRQIPPYDGGWWGTQPEKQKPPRRTVEWKGTATLREILLGALRDPSADIRKVAIEGIADLNDPETLPSLLAALSAEKGQVRADILQAIGAMKLPQAIPTFAAELADENSPASARQAAIAGLVLLKDPRAVGALAGVANTSKSPQVRVLALEALGTLKAPAGRPAMLAGLTDADAKVRSAGVLALGSLGDAGVADKVGPLLADADAGVRLATITAIGQIKAASLIPQLLPFVQQEATQFETIRTLAKMPDVRALPAYLTGMASKSPELRSLSRQAVAAIREPAAKLLQQMADRRELPAGALAELTSVYTAFAPIPAWNLIGPFPDDGKIHPPQTEQKLDAVYEVAGQKLKWRLAHKSGENGRVDLAGLFSPQDHMVAYGFARIDSATDRDAVLLIGSDDTIRVWVNRQLVHSTTGSRGWNFDSDKVPVKLKAGSNDILIACGNNSGPWDFSVGVSGQASQYAFLKGTPAKLDLEAYRAFARKTPGNVERGSKLVADAKGVACMKCHQVGGQGGNVGPSLSGIALKYDRETLMTSILEPSKTIANGYETVVITLLDGKTVTGVFKGENATTVNVADNEGKILAVSKKEIDERRFSPVSTMPNGLNEGMTLQDFADIVAWLEVRREK